MRALVVAPQPFFTPRGTPFSVFHRTRIAAELGVEIDLLTYGEGKDPDIPGVRIRRIPRLRFLEPVRVGPSYAKLILDIILFFWAVGLLIRRRYDFVHAHEEAAFFCTLLKPVFGFKLVYDMHSRLPRQLSNFGFTDSRWIISAFERFEKAALKASDAVITISPALARYARSQMEHPDRHLLIENTLFDEVVLVRESESPAPMVAAEMISGNGPVIAYAGTLEKYQGIDLLMEAYRRVLAEAPGSLLLLIGGSPVKVQEYREMAHRLGILDNCRFTGLLPHSHARRLLKEATLVVSPRISGDNTPLKIYEQMASGIPLVATRVPSHTQVLNEEVCFLASPEPEEFSRALLEGLKNHDRREQVVDAAKALYARDYSKAVYTEKMAQLLALLT